jgi:hypothetical protein
VSVRSRALDVSHRITGVSEDVATGDGVYKSRESICEQRVADPHAETYGSAVTSERTNGLEVTLPGI